MLLTTDTLVTDLLEEQASGLASGNGYDDDQ
jgi:hypothetical protein